MILTLAVSDDTMKRASSLVEILGACRTGGKAMAMDDILMSAKIGEGRSVHIATLSRQTIVDSGAEHLGFSGYFVFEASDLPGNGGIDVLGKAQSFEAALRLADIIAAALRTTFAHESDDAFMACGHAD